LYPGAVAGAQPEPGPCAVVGVGEDGSAADTNGPQRFWCASCGHRAGRRATPSTHLGVARA